MTNQSAFTRKELIEFYLSCNFQGSRSRNRCAKEITKFNKDNKTNKITIREIIAYALPSFNTFLLNTYPSADFVDNFRCPFTNVDQVNSTGYLWRFFDEYCQKFNPQFTFLGQTYVYSKYGCLETYPVNSSIMVESYNVFSLLRE